MKIVIIDGQGGRMGGLLAEKIKKAAIPGAEIYALGTNSAATTAMLKAGADYGATGENPVLVNCRDADYIIGPLGIMAADALLGGSHSCHGNSRRPEPRHEDTPSR